MNVMEWTALLITAGMVPIHEAAARVGPGRIASVMATSDDEDMPDARVKITDESLAYIREFWPTGNAREIGRHLGLSHATVGFYARQMGLTKDCTALSEIRKKAGEARK